MVDDMVLPNFDRILWHLGAVQSFRQMTPHSCVYTAEGMYSMEGYCSL